MDDDSASFVGPSRRSEEWLRGLQGDDELLAVLVVREPPGQVFYELVSYLGTLYTAGPESRIARILGSLNALRSRVGARQRDLDLGLLRTFRRRGNLSFVVGAGASIDAGGLSWADLVRDLLQRGLERGHEIRGVVERREAPLSAARFGVIRVEHFSAAHRDQAESILQRISSDPSTDDLLEGAELCLKLFGQHMFTHMHPLLYDVDRRQPGRIHRAIAELTQPFSIPSGKVLPGLQMIISYNFDDLLGEAIDALECPRVAWAVKAGPWERGDPNEYARAAGDSGVYQSLYHIHGYTPRRPFLLTGIKFVFSTSQYQAVYGDDRHNIIDLFVDRVLENPAALAVYVGCSFTDDAMNKLLVDAARRFPGRYHAAFMLWPGARSYLDSEPREIERHSERYVAIGVRPLWVDGFDDIPGLIRTLL